MLERISSSQVEFRYMELVWNANINHEVETIFFMGDYPASG